MLSSYIIIIVLLNHAAILFIYTTRYLYSYKYWGMHTLICILLILKRVLVLYHSYHILTIHLCHITHV